MDTTRARTTPKDFFLWAGAMVALYASVFSFLALAFDYINYAFPDPQRYYAANPYQGGVSYEMASLIVLFPVFLLLMWLLHRDIRRDHSRRDIWVRRWALMLTLFLAGATIAIDLITLIMDFLNGSLTTPFLLKVLIVLLVAAAGFMHFIADFWGYWEQYPERGRYVGWASGILVILTVFAGFLIIGTPWQARLYNFDAQKASDLMQIQSQVVSYWQAHQQLPANLAALNDPLSNYAVPTDPQTGQPFEYKMTSAKSFQLCATFNAPTQGNTPNYYSAPVPAGAAYSPENDNWYHDAGHTCFSRTIDPARYPPLKQ